MKTYRIQYSDRECVAISRRARATTYSLSIQTLFRGRWHTKTTLDMEEDLRPLAHALCTGLEIAYQRAIAILYAPKPERIPRKRRLAKIVKHAKATRQPGRDLSIAQLKLRET